MLSVVISSQRSYPALQLVLQLVHKRLVILGPLVQENGSFNFLHINYKKLIYFLHPKKIGSVLFLNALNPTHVPFSSANSRTLGSFFTSRIWWVDIEVPNDSVDKSSWESLACSLCYHKSFLSFISLSFLKGQTMSSTKYGFLAFFLRNYRKIVFLQR